MANFFIYFGDKLFGKLEEVCMIDIESSDFDSPSSKVFNSLNVSNRFYLLDKVFMGWSFLLLKVGPKIYHRGFRDDKHHEFGILEIFSSLGKDIFDVTCNLNEVFLITKDGLCYVCSNKNFQPVLIDFGNEQSKIKSVSSGDRWNLALTESGKIFILNTEDVIQAVPLPMPLYISKVTCGKEHVLLLTDSGQIFSFGSGSRGQLGHGTIENCEKPLILEALDGVTMKTIAAGGWHSGAVSDAGDLYMWGWNESGQLGLPCSALHSGDLPLSKIETVCCLPTIIELRDDAQVVDVSCGSRHTIALTDDNQVWTWGWNEYGQLGHQNHKLLDYPKVISLPKTFSPQQIKGAFWSTLIFGSMKS